jgi:hypothetical protein
MTWREMVGWSLVTAGGVCGAAAAVKGGLFEALTAASLAFASAAGTCGYTNKAAAPKQQ